MLAYPGYTVRTIRAELSMKRIADLMKCCAKDPPTAMTAAKLSRVVCILLDIDDATIPEEPSEDSESDVRSVLMGMGNDFSITFEE